MYGLIQHRVLGDLDVRAGPGYDLGGEERLGQPTVPRDNPQPAEEQINTGPQSLKASPSQSVTRKNKKKILYNIEETLLKRQRVRDEETDRLRSNGGSLWIMDQVPLGHKSPRQGMARLIHCPACRGLLTSPLALSSSHVLFECMAVEGTRMRVGIRDFINRCSEAGRSHKTTRFLYVNGKDQCGNSIPPCISRGEP